MENNKNWKYYLGITLFVYSFIPYAVSGLLLFLKIPLGKLMVTIGIFLASAEIAFAISIILLGKMFVKALEKKIKELIFRRKVARPEKLISKQRHCIGVVLMLLSFLPDVVAQISLLLGYPRTGEGYVTLLLLMLLGTTMFIASFFILGAEFWDRLKKLFQWPGDTRPEGAPARTPCDGV